MVRRFVALLGLLFWTAGRAAFARAALLYLTVGIVAMIVFGRNAMTAADVTELAEAGRVFRIMLWSVWLLATTPAARAVLCEPSLFYWRSLPIPRLHFYLAQGLLLALCELPFALLYARGVGMLSGIAVLATTMSLHALWVTRARTTLAWMTATGLVLAVMWPLPIAGFFPISLFALGLALPLAFIAAPHHQLSHHRAVVVGPPLVALALAYLVTLWRGHAALLSRALLFTLLGVAISYLALRNNQITAVEWQSTIALGVLSVVLLLALCGLAGPLVRTERQAEWLLTVCHRNGWFSSLALCCALSICGGMFGILHGTLLALLLDADGMCWLRLCASEAAMGVVIALLASGCVRLAVRGNDKDTERLLLSLCVLVPLCAVLVWMFHELSLLFLLITALGLFVRADQVRHPSGRWQRLVREREQRGNP